MNNWRENKGYLAARTKSEASLGRWLDTTNDLDDMGDMDLYNAWRKDFNATMAFTRAGMTKELTESANARNDHD